jgi:glycosyltransferase involved in cell wall biosynthesis
MRIAWLGPAPCERSGPCYSTTLLLPRLAGAGIEVDCFFAAPATAVTQPLREAAGLSFFCLAPRWEWDRWYSRTPLMKFVSGQAARARAQAGLVGLIAKRHQARPYDLLLQYSQIELFSVPRVPGQLPPIVLHPSTHVAGELRWHRRESHLAGACEPWAWHLAVRAMLSARAWRQKRDIRLACLVIALSRRFGEHLCHDYGITPKIVRVVGNPIDLERFTPPDPGVERGGPLTILFVSRISVRKGIEMVVSLSHRLADLEGAVRIQVVGERTLWSDYRPLLQAMNPALATYLGDVPPPRLAALYREAGMLVQPSRYEPFALTVGEALASGVPVAASSEVGAAEDVDRRCCVVFPDGDMGGFERAVRELVARARRDRAELAGRARAEAERLFDPSAVAACLAGHLKEAAGQHTRTLEESRA